MLRVGGLAEGIPSLILAHHPGSLRGLCPDSAILRNRGIAIRFGNTSDGPPVDFELFSLILVSNQPKEIINFLPTLRKTSQSE